MANRVTKIVVDITKLEDLDRVVNMLERAQKRWFAINLVLKEIGTKVDTAVLQPMLKDLQKYPAKRDQSEPVNWTSDKQHKYVMMMMRKKRIKLPTKRTNELATSWIVEFKVSAGKLRIRIRNTSPKAQFVIGRIGLSESARGQRAYLKPQQEFHRETGWRPAYPIVQKGMAKAEKMFRQGIDEFVAETFEE